MNELAQCNQQAAIIKPKGGEVRVLHVLFLDALGGFKI
jgi:hypothetical protein